MSNAHVWIFNNSKGMFPGGVFTTLEIAEKWIFVNKLTGVLTQYPLDVGSYDWAKANGLVSEKLARKVTGDFVGSFSSASFLHFHYEKGEKQGVLFENE
jgi:hypothetical protein